MEMLKGKVALITGGSRGIGKAIALKYASEGADIAFIYRNRRESAEETLAQIKEFGVKAECYAADVAQMEEVKAVVAKVLEEFGKIDILVNNAGVARDTLLMRMSEEQWDTVIDTNLKSAFNFCSAVVPAMMAARKGGSIINMSSVVGLRGNKGQSNYAASKAGLIGFSQSLSKEVGARNIRVNCIAPGFIISDMTTDLPEDLLKSFINDIALRRGGTPEEVAGVALFLASDLSSYVSGEVINCSGHMKG